MGNNSASPALETSQTDFAPNGFNWIATIGVICATLVIVFVVLGAAIVFWLAGHGLDTQGAIKEFSSLYGVGVQSLAELIAVLFLLLVLPPLAGTDLRGLGFRAIAKGDAIYVVGAIVAMFVLTTVLGSFLENALHVKGNEEAVQMFLNLHGMQRALFAIFAVVVGPLAEEMFYRVLIFNAMRKWWGLGAAMIVNSIVFGASHAQKGSLALNISLIVPLAVGGFVLCWVYARTRSAWSNIITHASFNGLSLLLLVVAPQLAK